MPRKQAHGTTVLLSQALDHGTYPLSDFAYCLI